MVDRNDRNKFLGDNLKEMETDKQKVNLILYSGGYKYPFYNGVMRFFDMHRHKFDLDQVVATSSASFCAAMHASGYTSDHAIKDLVLNLSRDKILKYRNKKYYIYSESFAPFINIDAIKRRRYTTNICIKNTKTNEISLVDITQCNTNEEVIRYITAAHSIPGVTEMPVGNKEDGYLVNCMTEKISHWKTIKRDKDTLDVIVFQSNPLEVQRNELKLFSKAEMPINENLQKDLFDNVDDFIFAYPKQPLITVENDEIGGFADFYEGYRVIKDKLRHLL